MTNNNSNKKGVFRRILNLAVKRSAESLVAATTETATSAATKSYDQTFDVTLPITVFVRASHSSVTVQMKPGNQVRVSANLQAFFGWELVTEQDDAGIYIVAKRKPIVGSLSRAKFNLIVPPEANLVFHLTPGTIKLIGVNGKITFPPGTLNQTS